MHSYIKELTEHDVKPTVGSISDTQASSLVPRTSTFLTGNPLPCTSGTPQGRKSIVLWLKTSTAAAPPSYLCTPWPSKRLLIQPVFIREVAILVQRGQGEQQQQCYYLHHRNPCRSRGEQVRLELRRQVTRQQLYEWTSKNHVDAVEEISARDLGSIRRLFNNLAEKIHLDKLLRKV